MSALYGSNTLTGSFYGTATMSTGSGIVGSYTLYVGPSYVTGTISGSYTIDGTFSSGSITNLLFTGSTGLFTPASGSALKNCTIGLYKGVYGGTRVAADCEIVALNLNGNMLHQSNYGNYANDGFYLRKVAALTITNCQIYGVRGCGIRCVSTGQMMFKDNNIIGDFTSLRVGNTYVTGSATLSGITKNYANTWCGIFIDGFTDNRLINNEVGGITGPLVWLGVASDSTLLTQNMIGNPYPQYMPDVTGISNGVITFDGIHTLANGDPVYIENVILNQTGIGTVASSTAGYDNYIGANGVNTQITGSIYLLTFSNSQAFDRGAIISVSRPSTCVLSGSATLQSGTQKIFTFSASQPVLYRGMEINIADGSGTSYTIVVQDLVRNSNNTQFIGCIRLTSPMSYAIANGGSIPNFVYSSSAYTITDYYYMSGCTTATDSSGYGTLQPTWYFTGPAPVSGSSTFKIVKNRISRGGTYSPSGGGGGTFPSEAQYYYVVTGSANNVISIVDPQTYGGSNYNAYAAAHDAPSTAITSSFNFPTSYSASSFTYGYTSSVVVSRGFEYNVLVNAANAWLVGNRFDQGREGGVLVRAGGAAGSTCMINDNNLLWQGFYVSGTSDMHAGDSDPGPAPAVHFDCNTYDNLEHTVDGNFMVHNYYGNGGAYNSIIGIKNDTQTSVYPNQYNRFGINAGVQITYPIVGNGRTYVKTIDSTNYSSASIFSISSSYLNSPTDAIINSITVGRGSGSAITNTVFGNSAAQSLYTGSNIQITAVGYNALKQSPSSSVNATAIGYLAMGSVASATNIAASTAVGASALQTVTAVAANSNTAIGAFAMQTVSGSTVAQNTAVGANALQICYGQNNVAVGQSALQFQYGSVGANIAIGNASQYRQNSFVNGNNNISIGNSSLGGPSGVSNIAIGSSTGQYLSVNSSYNTAVGTAALNGAGSNTLVSASNTVAIGANAGSLSFVSASNSSNIFIGFRAGYNTSGSNNIVIGAGGILTTAYDAAVGGNSNQLSIGSLIYGTGLYSTSAKMGIGVTAPVNTLDVKGNISCSVVSASLFSGVATSALTASYAQSFVINNSKYTNATVVIPSVGIDVTLLSQTTGSFSSAFYNYSLSSGSNIRAGTIVTAFNATDEVFNEITTADLGDTSQVTMSVQLTGGAIKLIANAANTNNWTVNVSAQYV